MLYTMKLSDLRLSMWGRTNENPPWRHTGRRMDYSHLVLVVSGSCECQVANRTYTVHGGDLLFLPAQKFYRLTTADHCEYCFACFYGSYKKAAEGDREACMRVLPAVKTKFYLPDAGEDTICLVEHTRPDVATYSNLLTLFTKGQGLYATGQYLDRLMLDVYFKELLLVAAKATGAGHMAKYPLSLERMLRYIDQAYTERISPETLAERFSLSKEHICTLFRRELDMTVSEYVNMVKLNHAVELLSNSSMNVSQISEYLGYSSVYYFSRVFKKRYGVSPTGYQEK